MNKITRKLFLYFVTVAVLLAVTVFLGFCGTFKYYSFNHHEEELQARAEVITGRLENYIAGCTDNQELSAYIRVLDDISLADAYFVSRDSEKFVCPCSCGVTVSIEKTPTEEVSAFAENVFMTGEYKQETMKNADGSLIYIGMPVKEMGETIAVVVMVDKYDMDRASFLLSLTILLCSLIIALIVAVLISSFLAKRFMVPIHKIAAATRELTKGNYKAETHVSDNNEIGELAEQTDFLAKKLEASEQMQKNYIVNLSHELRTPVAVIRSSAEALRDGLVDDEKCKDYHEQMVAEAVSLQRLVNDMLELSRLENEEFSIEKERLDLLLVLEDAVRSTRLMARQKDINVHFNHIADEWIFEGDYGRLRQMFITVLDNAIKYSDREKNVRIEVKRETNNYYIAVEDEGYGIPEEKQATIYNKFFRASSGEGTGLGLVIMKNIAKRHGITVNMYSKEAKGTRFVFIIPIDKNLDN